MDDDRRADGRLPKRICFTVCPRHQSRSPRKRGHLSQPKDYRSECDDGEIVSSGPLEAYRHASGLLEFAETTLDEVALCIEVPVELMLDGSGGVVGDDDLRPFCIDGAAQAVAVIGGIRHHDVGVEPLDEGVGVRSIAPLSAGQGERDGAAQPSHGHVDLGAQAAS